MNTREQFGKYLLLKKLTEDPLGETFRAGMLGAGGMERVALLRVMNGQGIDGRRLWQACHQRAGILQVLRSPNHGEGIEMAEIQGIPYVAYEYISGKNLATLLEQAAVKRNFIPAEHALLITERIALGLASASESRHNGERILHGFLVPHLVMISNEGETRLLGFEIAPGLRTFAANPVIRQHFGRYLAPEALSGAAPDPVDDIYSLGVVLLELLTGKPLPPPAPDGFGQVIDQCVVATEGTPIPAELADLLKGSLVAREHRISDVVTWHKTLNKWMFDGQYNPTTFNLAFFMHNLFRQEIERESQEIEVEKTLPLPVAQPKTGATPVVAEPAVAEPSGVHETVAAQQAPPVPPGAEKSKTGLIAAAAAVVALLLGGGYWWSQKGESASEQTADTATQPLAQPPAEPAVVVPTGPTPEEVNEQIRELIGQRANEMEEQLRRQYDSQLADLQGKLELANREAEVRKQREQELAEEKAREEEAAKEAQRLAEEQAAAEEAAIIAAAEEKRKEEEAAKLAAAEAEAAATAPPPATPAAVTQVRRGDLVTMGPGVTPPKLIRRPTPRFPTMAKRLNKKDAKVLIKVLIDENGRVIKAELAGKEQGYGFDDEALASARKSIYEPAKKNNVPVKFWQSLAVEFRDR